MRNKSIQKGKGFELAVHAFAKSLNPAAEVLFNHKVEDRDTKTLRQCDVWINTTIGGHWPLSVLVSCKDHQRKLHVGDIGAFINEVTSTGASTGVIYSRYGFTKPAILKAKVNGIACCRLFENKQADIPEAIIFHQYTCNPYFRFTISENPDPSRFRTWNDIFDAEVEIDGTIRNIIDILVEEYLEGQTNSIDEGNNRNTFPLDWRTELTMTGDELGGRLRLTLVAGWHRYKAQVEGHLLNGSYSINNSAFCGSISGPAIDTQSTNPGAGWTRVEGVPEVVLPNNRILMMLGFQSKNLKDHIRSKTGDSSLAISLDNELPNTDVDSDVA